MNNPYVLPVLVLGFCLLLLAVYFIYARRRGAAKRIYRPKGPYLLSEGERKFFEALQHCTAADQCVLNLALRFATSRWT